MAETSRQEYPAMLASLQPAEAVTLLNDRVKQVDSVNREIASWLAERRRVEELYVQGLRKLARASPRDESFELGVFTSPWNDILTSTLGLAESHQILAQKIEKDVERPLRDFSTTNREMQAMSTMQGNLASIARELEEAQKKTDRLQEKGGKAATSKVAEASSAMDNVTSQWASQAPYIFETLQAVDETRLNHLRDVLTQYQTHEVDQVERSRKTAERCLNSILNVEAANEIKAFSSRQPGSRPVRQKPPPERRDSRNPFSSAPISAPQDYGMDDGGSQLSESVHEVKKGALSNLRRGLGTVMGRRKSSIPGQTSVRPSAPTKKSSSIFNPINEKRSTRPLDPPELQQNHRSPSPGFFPASPPRQGTAPGNSSSNVDRHDTLVSYARNAYDDPSPGVVNGTNMSEDTVPQHQEPLQRSLPSAPAQQVSKDAEGYNMPSSSAELISQAQQEAVSAFDQEQTVPQLKVDIRNAPISEEGSDADRVMANMANTLRAQAAPARRAGPTRGRRDVRNTMFVPASAIPDISTPNNQITSQLLPLTSSPTSTVPPPVTSLDPPTQAHRQLGNDEHAGSDTQSIRSARSLASAGQPMKHPDMHGPGLNSSIVETVNAWFEHGQVARATVIGELALAYGQSGFPSPSAVESIRLENFQTLEKVAPNPAFIDQIPDRPGEYMVNVNSIPKTAVAFKYQVHIDEATFSKHAPLLISPAWKVEPTQTSVILNYSLNPAFTQNFDIQAVTLGNLVLIINLGDGAARANSCLSKPTGTFMRDRGLIYWRFEDLVLKAGAQQEKVIARFVTDTAASPGIVEARWEISGGQVAGLGSGLSVSHREDSSHTGGNDGTDPFADEDANNSGALSWKEVQTMRKLVSGTYQTT